MSGRMRLEKVRDILLPATITLWQESRANLALQHTGSVIS